MGVDGPESAGGRPVSGPSSSVTAAKSRLYRETPAWEQSRPPSVRARENRGKRQQGPDGSPAGPEKRHLLLWGRVPMGKPFGRCPP